MANSKFYKLTLDFSNRNSKRFSVSVAWTEQVFPGPIKYTLVIRTIDKLVDYGLTGR
jgi:hypothetical protein